MWGGRAVLHKVKTLQRRARCWNAAAGREGLCRRGKSISLLSYMDINITKTLSGLTFLTLYVSMRAPPLLPLDLDVMEIRILYTPPPNDLPCMGFAFNDSIKSL